MNIEAADFATAFWPLLYLLCTAPPHPATSYCLACPLL